MISWKKYHFVIMFVFRNGTVLFPIKCGILLIKIRKNTYFNLICINIILSLLDVSCFCQLWWIYHGTFFTVVMPRWYTICIKQIIPMNNTVQQPIWARFQIKCLKSSFYFDYDNHNWKRIYYFSFKFNIKTSIKKANSHLSI